MYSKIQCPKLSILKEFQTEACEKRKLTSQPIPYIIQTSDLNKIIFKRKVEHIIDKFISTQSI